MSDERRSAHRVRISGVRVTYDGATGQVEADVLDLGSGGLFVRTAAPLAVGKRISMEIQVIGEKGPWSVLGRVVWTRDKGEGNHAPPGMGVKVIDADEGVITAIEHLVETRERTEPGVGGPGSTPPPPMPSAPPPPPPPDLPPGRQREPTLTGVGPPSGAPSFPAREQSIAFELVPRKQPSVRPAAATAPDARSAAREASQSPTKAPAQGGGRWIVVLLLFVVAGIAAYVLIDGFLRPPH